MSTDLGGINGVRAHLTKFGFRFGAALVERVSAVRRGKGQGHHVCIRVKTASVLLDVYVSPSGRRVRVFKMTTSGAVRELK